MGLDMYLKGKRYLSGFNDQDKEIAAAVQKLFPELEGRTGTFEDRSCVQQIEISVGYWRKANMIHDWFVKNVQGGEDQCNPHHVAREQLIELKELCQQVLDNKKLAAELLPTASGFFFGSTDYDEWYFKDLENTVAILDRTLELSADWDIEYQSSW